MPEKVIKTEEKTSIFYKINQKWQGIKKDWLIKFKAVKDNQELKSSTGMLGDIFLLGLLISLSLMPFGFSFSIINLVCFGCLFWFFREKVLPILTSLLSSFSLVNSHNYK